MTGVVAARAPIVVTLDGDGQNDPRFIPDLISHFDDPEVGLVAGQRVGRKSSLAKKIGSRIANRLRRALLADATRDTACGVKAFRREPYLKLPYFENMHRFLPALFLGDGWRIAHIDVVDRPRQHGCRITASSTGWRSGSPTSSAYGGFSAGGGEARSEWSMTRDDHERRDLGHDRPGRPGNVFRRFVVQWIASERAGRSVIPFAFWFFSVAGGLIVLVYAIYRVDPVFIIGNTTGLFIYGRNIFLIVREKRNAPPPARSRPTTGAAPGPEPGRSGIAGSVGGRRAADRVGEAHNAKTVMPRARAPCRQAIVTGCPILDANRFVEGTRWMPDRSASSVRTGMAGAANYSSKILDLECLTAAEPSYN